MLVKNAKFQCFPLGSRYLPLRVTPEHTFVYVRMLGQFQVSGLRRSYLYKTPLDLALGTDPAYYVYNFLQTHTSFTSILR